MIEVATKLLLEADDDVTDLTDSRIYHLQKPQNITAPSLVITLIDATRNQTFQGASGFVSGSLQIECFAPTYQEAKSLAAKVRLATDGYRGTLGGIVIPYLELDREQAIPIVFDDGRDTPSQYGIRLDYRFAFFETPASF